MPRSAKICLLQPTMSDNDSDDGDRRRDKFASERSAAPARLPPALAIKPSLLSLSLSLSLSPPNPHPLNPRCFFSFTCSILCRRSLSTLAPSCFGGIGWAPVCPGMHPVYSRTASPSCGCGGGAAVGGQEGSGVLVRLCPPPPLDPVQLTCSYLRHRFNNIFLRPQDGPEAPTR